MFRASRRLAFTATILLAVSCSGSGFTPTTAAPFDLSPEQQAVNRSAPIAFTLEKSLPVADGVGGGEGVVTFDGMGCARLADESGEVYLLVVRPQLFRWNAETERLEYGSYEQGNGSRQFHAEHSFASGDRARFGGHFPFDPERHTIDRSLDACEPQYQALVVSRLDVVPG